MGLIIKAEADAHLKQGDILVDVQVYASEHDEAGSPIPVKSKALLVISRNCNAFRKDMVTVAAITDIKPEMFSRIAEKSLDEIRKAFFALRDGDGMPDVFYLGHFPDQATGRLAAKLDMLFSIKVPTNEKDRKDWVAKHRVATLSNDHRRHLHARIMLAFGREGFDDFAWWPDEDLKIAIVSGKQTLLEADKKRTELLSQYQSLCATFTDSDKKKKLSIETQQNNANATYDQAKKELAPFEDEWRRRHGDLDPLVCSPHG